MLKQTTRLLFALSLTALLLACSSKEDGKTKESAEPKAAEPKAADTPPAPVAEPPGRKTMMSKNPQGKQPGAAAEEGAPATGLIPKFEKLAERACKCTDKGCANKIQDEVGKLAAELATVQDNEKQKLGAVMQKLTKCIQDAQK